MYSQYTYNDKVFESECIYSLQSATSLYLTHLFLNQENANRKINPQLHSVANLRVGNIPSTDTSAWWRPEA